MKWTKMSDRWEYALTPLGFFDVKFDDDLNAWTLTSNKDEDLYYEAQSLELIKDHAKTHLLNILEELIDYLK